MANRVCLGQKSAGQFGLWISKPGVDVLSASLDQMLLATDLNSFQIITSGNVLLAASASSVTIDIPNFGFRPLLMWTGEWVTGGLSAGNVNRVTYNSNTNITFTAVMATPFDYRIYYAVLNEVMP